MLRPVRAGSVGAAGQPPLLPGIPGLLDQPVQQQRHTDTADFVDPSGHQLDRRGRNDLIDLVAIAARGRPIHSDRTNRIARTPIRLRNSRFNRVNIVVVDRRRCGGDLDDSHERFRANSTSSVSGR